MYSHFFSAVNYLLLVLNIFACGDEKPEENNYSASAQVSVSNASMEGDDGEYSYTQFASCHKDIDSGLLTIAIAQSQSSLNLSLKNFVNSPKEYECRQAADNKDSDTSLGGKYESCAVDLEIQQEDGINGYSMYRSSLEMDPFSYSGACNIVVSTVDEQVSGTFECFDLIQTKLDSDYRNPIDESILADANGNFQCDLIKIEEEN